MMARRTSLMVASDILQEARGGSNKTNLVYRCNLNFKIIKTWLSRLIAKGLIELSSSPSRSSSGSPSRTWTTTTKGLRFILAMDGVLSMWEGRAPPASIELGVVI